MSRCQGCPDCHVTHDCDDCGKLHIPWSAHDADARERAQRVDAFGIEAELLFGQIEKLCEGVPDDLLALVFDRLERWIWDRRDAIERWTS